MKKYSLSYHISRCAAVAALCLLVSACSMSDDPECPGGQGGGRTATAYMRLSLGIPSDLPSVRAAAPSGGENGDGKEDGQTYENAVSDALVFLLPVGADVNSPAGTKILDVLYFSTFTKDGDKWKSESVETEVETGATYPVIVVANPGDRAWTAADGLNLGKVRDHIYTEAWKQQGSSESYSYFLMSSEKDGSVAFTAGGGEEKPAVAEVDVERVAARVDYKADASYTCTDPAYANGSVTIEGAALVNDLTAGSYLLKRVADEMGGQLEYLGDETPESGVQTNYVIDPWTASKTAANASSGTPFALPGGTSVAASGLYGLYYNDRAKRNPSEWKDIVKAGTQVVDPVTQAQWQRVGYTLENTTSGAEAGKAYYTGVVFRAKFRPAGLKSEYLTSMAGSTILWGPNTPNLATTYFAVGNTLYNTLEDVMLSTTNYNIFNKFGNSLIYEDVTYGDLKSYMAGISVDLTGYKTWLMSEIEDKTDDERVEYDARTSLSFRTYAKTKLGYSITTFPGSSTKIYSLAINQSDIDTRSKLIQYGVRTYENANCYYTYWIRHSGDDTPQKGEDGFWHNKMGHAIVRNNIYKISVTSIYSLGGDVPDPDINPAVHVWANKWTLLPEETLDM